MPPPKLGQASETRERSRGTSRGFGVAEFKYIGELIVEVLDALSAKGAEADEAAEAAVRHKVKVLLARFPIYPD